MTMSQKDRSFRLLFWVLALTALAIDQGSKYGVFGWLKNEPGRQHVLFQVPEKGGFQLVAEYRVVDGIEVPHVNQGALFGFLSDHKALANMCLAIVSLAAALAIVFWTTLASTARDAWLCASLGLILGGTLGNLYDRLVFSGVRDFLHWNYLFNWPVFNFADCCLVCGAGLLLIQAFLTQPVANQAPTESATATAPGSTEMSVR
jgi:signal peptidase II